MKSQKVKTAVVGLGSFGRIHARTYSSYNKSELVSICDIDEDKVLPLSKKLECNYCLNSKEIASDDSIDVVSIATPDFAHLEVAIQMINANKNVLIEKPLATSTEDAKKIIEAAEKHGVALMTDFQNRWNPPMVAAKKAMESGEIGNPVMFSTELSNKISNPLEVINWSDKSGPEWYLFPHIIDLGIWLLEKNPQKVFAWGQKEILPSKGIDAYDAIQAEVVFEDCCGVFKTAWIMPENMSEDLKFEFDLLGSNGKFKANPNYNGISITNDEGERIPFISGWQKIPCAIDGFFAEPIKHFIDHVYGDCELHTKPEDGLIVTKTIEAILRSVENEKIVNIQ